MSTTLETEARKEQARVEHKLSRTHSKTIQVKRTGVMLCPDRSRVLIRPFTPFGDRRAVNICARVMAMPESDVCMLLQQVLAEFGERHQQIKRLLQARFEQAREYLLTDQPLSVERKQLLGAYFTHEYSLEAAALFNPSIVPHPDKSDLPAGSLRFILSLRATGEGHISSVTFRTGVIDRGGQITISEPTRYCLEPTQVPNPAYEKALFERKLRELGLLGDFSRSVLQSIVDSFTLEELEASVGLVSKEFRTRAQGIEAYARKTLA